MGQSVRFGVLIAAVLTGCNPIVVPDADPPPPGNGGGSAVSDGGSVTAPVPPTPEKPAPDKRLRRRVYLAEDGSKEFLGWHDTALDMDCAFLKTPKGMRCMPKAGMTVGYFSDSQCTAGVAVFPDVQCGGQFSTPPPIIMKSHTGVSCAADIFYETGARVTDIYWKNPDLGCVNANAMFGADAIAYNVGPEIDYLKYVGATETLE